MTCHQGARRHRRSTRRSPPRLRRDDDTVSATLSFKNIHYFPAAATLYAGRVQGGYQYAGQIYDVRFRHVDGNDTCIGCHDPHSTKVKFTECAACHTGVTDARRRAQIRMMSSIGLDYDGDGKHQRGHLRRARRPPRQARHRPSGPTAPSKTPPDLLHARHLPLLVRRHATATGSCSTDEAVPHERLQRAGPRASCAPPTTTRWRSRTRAPSPTTPSTSSSCSTTRSPTSTRRSRAKVDMSKATRTDFGHFNGASDAARHWDTSRRGRSCRRDLLVRATAAQRRLPVLRPVRGRPGRPGDRQRPRVRHLPHRPRHGPKPTSRRSSRSRR